MSDIVYNIELNGVPVTGTPGETIMDVTRRNGIFIPTMCHDDRLEPYASCYICVVEVEGMRYHQPACSTRIAEGMKINTDNERVRKSRRMALELILSNHYADCTGPCKQTCPAGVDVQGYISLIDKGLYHEAVALIKQTNPLPAICGRVCVRPCEAQCRRNLLNEGAPVGVDYMKRFIADNDLASDHPFIPVKKPSTGKKVAVIGAGPGGLSAAWFLQLEGHQADIYEAAPKAGGWLRYGIPEYRLPNSIVDKEVQNITDLGVNIFYNQRLGENISYRDLKKQYDAVILTIGSQQGTGVGCEGDDAENVLSGIDFLKNMELTGKRYDFTGRTVAVIGGGNTAMDCCRTAVRCNAGKVYVIYRRTEKEMPANPIEIHESKVEGVEYLFLTLPKKINKNDQGGVESITCIRMELGEPDASGRRRPVPVEGSDFNVKVDVVLAAIGQKTDVNFLEDLNSNATAGELKLTKWGDMEADKYTLQTGIPSVFAAGDGVTGPATIIEAIAQARIAARSAHQYLSGELIIPPEKPFISRKENFKQQTPEDYRNRFDLQPREEMPVLPACDRKNFCEVELGYPNEKSARDEALRCLECGCVAFFNCRLQQYATEYRADQRAFQGAFKEYRIDFRHPYIEIDNNKCILCARCVRICHEVVGADALGLVNRGFETYVAPSMGDALTDTPCESCGLCISACPTGAIIENVPFKPGPVRTELAETICPYCSVGCAVTLKHINGFITGTTGAPGIVNPDTNICRFPKFGYHLYNDSSRITRPLLKTEDGFREIGFEQAFDLIAGKIHAAEPSQHAFAAGARLTNEEMYLIRKLAAATGENRCGSFLYAGRAYRSDHRQDAPLASLKEASRIYLLGTAINRDFGVAGFMVSNARFARNIPVTLVTAREQHPMRRKVDELIRVKSYYAFVKALNHDLLSRGREDTMFLRDRVANADEYRSKLLAEPFGKLLDEAGLSAGELSSFADQFINEPNAVLIWSEKESSPNTALELANLALITGKMGKPVSGLIGLSEKNNSQGLRDSGLCPAGEGKNEPSRSLDALLRVKNLFIFGEDPVGCAATTAYDVEGMIRKVPFLVVQDYFMTETARHAHLILPASFPAETGGSFTNTQHVRLEFEPVLKPRTALNNLQQLSSLLGRFGITAPVDPKEIFRELITQLPPPSKQEKMTLEYTPTDNPNRFFHNGCDDVERRFGASFKSKQ